MPPARAKMEMEVDDSVIMIGEQLRPLFQLIGRQSSCAVKEFQTHECHNVEKEFSAEKGSFRSLWLQFQLSLQSQAPAPVPHLGLQSPPGQATQVLEVRYS